MPREENWGVLSRGRNKVIMIRELALGATPKAELARRYGVTARAVTFFEQRHALEITEARGDLENEWVGLWVAEKRNRVAELQQLIEDLNEQIAKHAAGGYFDNNVGLPAIKLVAALYEQVAKELGQIPKQVLEVAQSQPVIVYDLGEDLEAALG